MKSGKYRRFYSIVVITIVAVTVTSQIIIRTSLEKQTNDGNKISIAGYQAYLSSEIAKNCLRVQFSVQQEMQTKSLVQDLQKDFQKLESRHYALQHGNAYNLTGENSERANQLLLETEKLIQLLKPKVNTLGKNLEVSTENVNNIILLTDEYSEKLKEVAYEFKASNSQKIESLKLLELLLAIIMISVLILEVFLVIRPALNNLGQRNKDLQVANQKLQDSNRVKTEFLANMSHEIRTPLNGVIGMANLLSRSKLNQEQKESVQTIHKSANNLLLIINEILDYSKLESGKTESEKIEFEPRVLIDDVIDLLLPSAESKGLTIENQIDANVPSTLVSDEGKIRQVLINLLGNAIKFSEKGEIRVELRTLDVEEEFVELEFTVADSGIGIAEEKLSSIFESFTQADNSTTRKFGGTGLGLSISKNLVALLNGRIWAQSDLGKGSKFKFTCVTESPQGHNSINLRANVSDKTALIIDDKTENLTLLVRTLANWGISSTPFNDPELLYSVFNDLKNFDLCIINKEIPEMQDLGLAKRIRNNYSAEQLPIIITSSFPEETTHHSEKPYYEHYIRLPIKQKKLLNTINHVFKLDSKSLVNDSIQEIQKFNESSSGLSVLVAEDNSINKAVAQKSLELLGIKAEIANDGLEVIEKLEAEIFDLILMDIQMPNLDGFETTNRIRKQFSSNDQPIIFAMTAASTNGEAEVYTKKGMDDFIPKPLDVDVLAQKINEWFSFDSV